MVVKIELTDPPARPIAATATNEMRPTSNAYSIRSCPSSLHENARRRVISFMTFLSGAAPAMTTRIANQLDSLRELLLNVGEDLVDRSAGQADGGNGDQRDQAHEQRVLDQVLSLFVPNERTQASNEIH